MTAHNDCDWIAQKAFVLDKFESLSGDIKAQASDIRCLTRKVADLRTDYAAITPVLDDIKGDIADIKTQNKSNNSRIFKANVDIGKLQTRIALIMGGVSFIIATAVSIIMKYAL